MLKARSCLGEECVWFVGLHKGSLVLGDPLWKRELDVGIVHLLDQGPSALAGGDSLTSDDLDGVVPGSMPGSHIDVTGGNSLLNRQVTVLPVHVVGSRSGVISQPDSVILHLLWVLLIDTLTGDNLTSGLLELTQLTQKVPKPGLSNDMVGSKDSHPVQRSNRLILCGKLSSYHSKLLQSQMTTSEKVWLYCEIVSWTKFLNSFFFHDHHHLCMDMRSTILNNF